MFLASPCETPLTTLRLWPRISLATSQRVHTQSGWSGFSIQPYFEYDPGMFFNVSHPTMGLTKPYQTFCWCVVGYNYLIQRNISKCWRNWYVMIQHDTTWYNMIQHDTTNNMTWVCLKMALYSSFLLVLPLGDFRTLRVRTGDWKSTMAIKTCDDSLEDSTLRAAQHFDTKIYGPYPTCMCTWDMNGYVVGTASYIHPSWIWGKLFLKPLNQIKLWQTHMI